MKHAVGTCNHIGTVQKSRICPKPTARKPSMIAQFCIWEEEKIL